MAIRPPVESDLAAIGERYGLALCAADLASFSPFVTGLLGSWDAVEELYASTAPAPRPTGRGRARRTPTTRSAPGTSRPRSPRRRRPARRADGGRQGQHHGRRRADDERLGHLEGFVPTRDATVVTRMLAAGATITGKAVCEDLCFSGGSHTSRTGPVRNPWDATRSAGGSSSGSAALVAAGVVDLATGGDQGGSVRIPSAYSGTVGHKPTHGLVPYTGAFPIEQTIDHVGPITRTVADAALVLDVIAGPDGLDPRQPRTWSPRRLHPALDGAGDGLRDRCRRRGLRHPRPLAAGRRRRGPRRRGTLRGAGLIAEDVSIPWHADAMHVWNVIATEGATAQMVDANAYGMNWQGLYDPELIAYYGKQWRERGERFSETVKLVLLAGRYAIDTAYGSHYAMARNLAFELRRAYDEALASTTCSSCRPCR